MQHRFKVSEDVSYLITNTETLEARKVRRKRKITTVVAEWFDRDKVGLSFYVKEGLFGRRKRLVAFFPGGEYMVEEI